MSYTVYPLCLDTILAILAILVVFLSFFFLRSLNLDFVYPLVAIPPFSLRESRATIFYLFSRASLFSFGCVFNT